MKLIWISDDTAVDAGEQEQYNRDNIKSILCERLSRLRAEHIRAEDDLQASITRLCQPS